MRAASWSREASHHSCSARRSSRLFRLSSRRTRAITRISRRSRDGAWPWSAEARARSSAPFSSTRPEQTSSCSCARRASGGSDGRRERVCSVVSCSTARTSARPSSAISSRVHGSFAGSLVSCSGKLCGARRNPLNRRKARRRDRPRRPRVRIPVPGTTGVTPNGIGRRPRGALVLGGDYKALGIVRSLGRHGIPVWVLRDEHVIASSSRYCRRAIDWPAAGDPERVAFLLRLAAQNGLDGWALFPTDDETAAFLARSEEGLAPRFAITTPPWETLRWAYDKRLTYGHAAEIGIAHPRTYYPQDRAEVAAMDIAYPAILKPAIRAEQNRFTMSKAWRVDDRDSLLARYDEAARLLDPSLIMVQELIPGVGAQQLSYAALCRDGQPIASVVAQIGRASCRERV